MSEFNPGPESHGFNWGMAYRMSSSEVQFARLQEAFEQSVSGLNGDNETAPRTDIRCISPSVDSFSICRQALPHQQGPFVYVDHIFFRYNAGRIIIDDNRGGLVKILTSALNQNGRIRFQIDEEGDYLRWQIVRKYLEILLG